jgi:hypothetical protein
MKRNEQKHAKTISNGGFPMIGKPCYRSFQRLEKIAQNFPMIGKIIGFGFQRLETFIETTLCELLFKRMYRGGVA